MHKNAMKCNETLSKWCKNKHGASKIIDTSEAYQIASNIITTPFSVWLFWKIKSSSRYPGPIIVLGLVMDRQRPERQGLQYLSRLSRCLCYVTSHMTPCTVLLKKRSCTTSLLIVPSCTSFSMRWCLWSNGLSTSRCRGLLVDWWAKETCHPPPPLLGRTHFR
jgi:hypothetical protein